VLLTDIMAVFLENFNDGQIEKFGAGFGKWMESLHGDFRAELQTRMLSNARIRPFAVFLNSMYILESKEPGPAFWNLYEDQFSNSPYDIDLGPMATAYLQRSRNTQDAVKLLDLVPATNFGPESAASLAANMSDLSVKELFKVKSSALSKLIQLANGYNLQTNANKAIAVGIARNLEALMHTGNHPIAFAEAIGSADVRIGDFGKKDYQDYAASALPIFVRHIATMEDFRALLHMCFHEKYLEDFHDELSDALKKMGKRQESAQIYLVGVVCGYLIDFETVDFEARAFFRLFSKYLKKCEPDMMRNIQSAANRECQNKDSDFFARIHEKDGIGNRLGGLFGKK
jgi:hypothetical protein